MPFPDFGPFRSAFGRGDDTVPGYLCLLNLMDPAAVSTVVDRIEAGLTQPGHTDAMHALLRHADWRPHLVAGVAMMVMDDSQPFLSDLWSAIRAGSWVSPQLLAVAAVRDPHFLTTAAAREAESFRVLDPRGPWTPERHSATGPASSYGRAAKEAAAVLALCDTTMQGTAWAAGVRAKPYVQELLAADVDSGGEIATRWLSDIRAILGRRGRPPH